MAKISGYLKDGAGQAIAECIIILSALKTSNQVIEQIESYTTTKDGFYEINALTGQYEVILSIVGHPPKKVGVITVYSDSMDGTLNDFLTNGITNDDITPLLLSQLIEERKQAQDAALSAKSSAIQASSALANVVKKTGDTMINGLKILSNTNSSIEIGNAEGSDSYIINRLTDGKFAHRIKGTNGYLNRLIFEPTKNTWNFVNSYLTIDNHLVLKQGDYGLFLDKTPITLITKLEQLANMLSGERLFAKDSTATILPSSSHGYLTKLGARDMSNGGTFMFIDHVDNGEIFIGSHLKGTNSISWQKIATNTNSAPFSSRAFQNNAKIQFKKIAEISNIKTGKTEKASFLISGGNRCIDKYNSLDFISFGFDGANIYLQHNVLSDCDSSSNRLKVAYGYNQITQKYELWLIFSTWRGGFGITRVSSLNDNITEYSNSMITETAPSVELNYATPIISITTDNISKNNILQKGDYGLGAETQKNTYAIDLDTHNFETGFYSGNVWSASKNKLPFGSSSSTDWFYLINQNLASSGNKYKLQILGNAHEQRLAFRNWIVGAAKSFVEFVTTGNSTIDSNGFYKKASPVVRLVNPTSQMAIDACIEDNLQKVGDGFANDQAIGVQVKYLAIGHYQIQGSLGFAKSGWYIETPQDANGNKKLFVEYETDQNNVITVKTYQNCFENGRFVAGEPMDIPDGRWIDIRLLMSETSTD